MLTKEQRAYLTWISSLFLGYFAYIQPLNKLLSLIRSQGIISVSLGSVLDNSTLVMQVIGPTILLWLVLVMIWLVLLVLGIKGVLVPKLDIRGDILDKLVYAGIFIEMIWASLYYATFHMPFATILIFVAMQCFAFKIVLTEHTKREWIIIGALVALGIACELYTTRGFILRLVLLILASDGVDNKRVMKCYLIVNIAAFAVIMLVSGLGITGSWIEYDAYRSITDTQNRYIWGFNSPNTTHYVLIRLALVAMYIWWDKLRLWHIVAVFCGNYGLYLLTDSRTGFMVGFAACILAVFFKYFKKVRDWKIWPYLAVVMILTLVIFSLHFLKWNFYQYDTTHECPGYVYKVNDMMVGRIHQALKYTQDIEISPFGTRQSGVYCDMGYIKLFLQEGFVFFAIYIGVIIKMLFVQHRHRDYMGYIIIVSISLRMFMESSFVPFVFQNIIWLLLIGNWRKLEERT